MSYFLLRSGANWPRVGLVILSVMLTSTSAALAQSGGYVAQILIQTDQLVDAQTLSALKPADRARLQARGIQVIDAEQVLRSAPRPLSGHWVEIGKRRHMTDQQGFLRLPDIPATHQNLKIFVQVGDKTPIGTLPDVKFVPEGQTPTPSILTLKYKLKPQMNPPAETKETLQPKTNTQQEGSGEKKCNRASCAKGNAKGCCVDYNGPFGDGKPYNRKGGLDCSLKGGQNFIDSTCYAWVFLKTSAACANEGALPWNPKGPSCYENHKYRNCQNLDESALSLMPATVTVPSRGSTTLTVHNNTPSNYTCLRVSGAPGKPTLKIPSLGKGKLHDSTTCGGQRLDHFSDSAKSHYETIQVKFTAPKLPPGQCEGRYQVVAEGGGLIEKSDILVTDDGCAAAHIEFSLEGQETKEEDVKGGHMTTTQTMTYSGVVNLKVREGSDENEPSFELISGHVSANWTLSSNEQVVLANFQGCKYKKTTLVNLDVSGSRDIPSEVGKFNEGSVFLVIQNDGSYHLTLGAPSLEMKGTGKRNTAFTEVSPQCNAPSPDEITGDRTESMVVRFDTISGRLADPSDHAITGSKQITYTPTFGIPIKGTLKWKVSW